MFRGVPKDQTKLITLDPKSWRDGRVGGDRLHLVGVHGDQYFLIDEEARPGHERAHAVSEAVRQAKGDAVPGDVMERLPAPPQRQQFLAELDERGQGSVKLAVLVEEMAPLRTQAAKPAAE